MEAMVLRELVDLSRTPAPPELIEMPDPTTKLDEILVRRISGCGVCRTELDKFEWCTPHHDCR